MTTILLRRTLSGLAPADEHATAALKKFGVDQLVRMTINRPRNSKQHAKYWVLCTLVSEHHEELNTADQVSEAIKLLCGHCDVVAMRSIGEVVRIPRSISFSAMNQEEFDEYYRKACDAVVEHLMPGVSLREVQDEVLRLVA